MVCACVKGVMDGRWRYRRSWGAVICGIGLLGRVEVE
jgi:hypothetical protein